jgi:hypothetical protein
MLWKALCMLSPRQSHGKLTNQLIMFLLSQTAVYTGSKAETLMNGKNKSL